MMMGAYVDRHVIFMVALLQGAPQSAVGDRLPHGPQGLGIWTRDLSRAEREALPRANRAA